MPAQDDLNDAIADYLKRAAVAENALSPEAVAAREAARAARVAENKARTERLRTLPTRLSSVNGTTNLIVSVLQSVISTSNLAEFVVTSNPASVANDAGNITDATIQLTVVANPKPVPVWLTFQISEDQAFARGSNTAAETEADPSMIVGVNLALVPLQEVSKEWVHTILAQFLKRLDPLV